MKDWLDSIRDLSLRERALFVACLVLWPLCALIELAAGGLGYVLLWLAGRLPRGTGGRQ